MDKDSQKDLFCEHCDTQFHKKFVFNFHMKMKHKKQTNGNDECLFVCLFVSEATHSSVKTGSRVEARSITCNKYVSYI